LNLSITSLSLDPVGLTLLSLATLLSHLLSLRFQVRSTVRFGPGLTFAAISSLSFPSFTCSNLVLLTSSLISDAFGFDLGQAFGFQHGVFARLFLLTK
jgi:hypothetical protein